MTLGQNCARTRVDDARSDGERLKPYFRENSCSETQFEMPDKPQIVFVSSSRDMAEWAALATEYLKEFCARHGVPDVRPLDYRDIDPAHLDHSNTWQDSVGSPSSSDSVLTVVFFGERIGTPLPPDFGLRFEIFERLLKAGIDWVHIPGCSTAPLQSNQVPLTGVLFEFFDAFLPLADGSPPCPLRVIFKGEWDGLDDPEFGNGEFREQIEQNNATVQQKRLGRTDYTQQLEWLYLFWSKLFRPQQRISLFCADQIELVEELNKIFASTFLAIGDRQDFASFQRLDPRKIELPGPAPYDVSRASLYFGRAPQVAELTRRALRHKVRRRIVPVTGDSGAGKSSLLRSGLMQHALASARSRIGWRVALRSLTECQPDRSPILFLAESLSVALPELGDLRVLGERLEGLDGLGAAKRLLQILSELHVSQAPGFGQPKLLLVFDQLEIALDAVTLGSPDAPEWNIFLQTIAALGGGCLSPVAFDVLDPIARDIAVKLPISIVLAIPADRMSSLSAVLQPGDQVLWLPRLTDETAVQEIIRRTFATLGLTIEPSALEALCRQAVKLALHTQASVLPVLSATLASLHDEWKWRSAGEEHRHSAEEDWKAIMAAGEPIPLGLKLIVVGDKSREFDIEIRDLDQHKQLERAIGRLGDAGWGELDAQEANLRSQIEKLPISAAQQRVISGEITARDFALSWLLRHLVWISPDDTSMDRLVPLLDEHMPPFARPLADALRRNRVLTRHEDGNWWLVHLAVISGWEHAAAWREAEKHTFRTVDRMLQDYRRWKEEIAAGDPDAPRRLWTRSRDVEAANEFMAVWGAEDRPELAEFVRQSFIAAAAQNSSLAGRCLHAAVWFKDLDWAKAVLEAAGNNRVQATNRVNSAGSASVLSTSCHFGSVEIVRLLLGNGADPNGQVAGNGTPLLVAASVGAAEICEVLLAAGASPDCTNSDGWTPLMVAAEKGLNTTVERLLAAGVAIDHVSSQGVTALSAAAAWGHDTIVDRLLESGAFPDRADVDGKTALMYAAENGRQSVVARLLLAGARIDQSTHVVPNSPDRASTGKSTIEVSNENVPQNEVTSGWTALIFAAQNGHQPVVATLLAAGASVNALGNDSTTALMLAAAEGHDSVVAELIRAGAELDHTNETARASALWVAVNRGHHAVATRLIEAGAAVDQADMLGTTPLMLAVEQEDKDLVQLCLRHGARPERRNSSNFSALQLAYINKAQPIIDVLLANGVQPPSEAELQLILKHKPKMKIGLVVNAREKMCLVHNRQFDGIPHCVAYHMDRRQLEIILDNGKTYPIDWEATDEMDGYLQRLNKILIIRMQQKKPIEGYETALLHLKDGNAIELE